VQNETNYNLYFIILINVGSQIKFQGNGGLDYPFAVDGYEVALYEYWEVFVFNKKRMILWFQVFKKKKPNCS
jgi:hypothetical protein